MNDDVSGNVDTLLTGIAMASLPLGVASLTCGHSCNGVPVLCVRSFYSVFAAVTSLNLSQEVTL